MSLTGLRREAEQERQQELKDLKDQLEKQERVTRVLCPCVVGSAGYGRCRQGEGQVLRRSCLFLRIVGKMASSG